MRILGHLDRYGPPVGGGVITTVTILRELTRKGHEVRIVTNRSLAPDVPEIKSLEAPPASVVRELYDWSEVIVPHMTATPTAMKYARDSRKPVIYPVHDDGQFELYGVKPGDIALALFSSYGLMRRTAWPGDQLVVHPPTFIDEYRVETSGDSIALSSLSSEKGGELFWQLVDRMPDRSFIGVVGGWGDQIIPDYVPTNVEIVGHQGRDLRDVFRKTRILLVPSQRLGEGTSYWTENWGRAAIEAAASGIPSIASTAPGPVEALGDAGIFRDRNDVNAWVEAVRVLDDPEAYQRQSELVRRRAEELEVIVMHQLDELDAAIGQIARPQVMDEPVLLD
jgi:glycosyltransferase involved in cell wall biosynthesis